MTKLLKKGDIAVIVFFLLLSVFLFLLQFSSNSGKTVAEIYFDGDLIHRAVLDDVSEPYHISVNNAEIEISKDSAGFVESDCPDRICVRSGALSRIGDMAACVPNRVVLKITADDSSLISAPGTEQEGIDAVTY
ncbi:MAG: NusG domain II-containing protein [Lachnospiraceae bacterium]|nr:NusG domain II-containing protein [Lachnospiraceae bacterium]